MNEMFSNGEIIEQISDVLTECDGDFLEHIANSVLGRKVKYIGDGVFRYRDSEDEMVDED